MDPPVYPPSKRPPAMTYPFTLDEFQKAAIESIEHNESVLVAAHTSAGKTVVALYAIATALRDKQRVIYTSPIKALSNQKYRELKSQFDDVGLMTGDVTINVDAACLVMTTEILRNMLYRGTEVTKEVSWVIFDEIHYMRNYERGVVWEETIVMLPKKARFVFLSATIPNAREFAEWICSLHHQPCKIVSTDFRPVPLQTYVFPAGGKGLYLVLDEHGQFRENSFATALRSMVGATDLQQGPNTVRRGMMNRKRKDFTEVQKIVGLIMTSSFDPCIVFCFRFFFFFFLSFYIHYFHSFTLFSLSSFSHLIPRVPSISSFLSPSN